VHADHGDISLALPHCCRGPVTIDSGHERSIFSPALNPAIPQLSDVLGERVSGLLDSREEGTEQHHLGDDEEQDPEGLPVYPRALVGLRRMGLMLLGMTDGD